MSTEVKNYELTTTLSINSKSATGLDEYVARLEEALVAVIREYGAITAYFVDPDNEAVEIQLGLRFEGMDPEIITEVADEVLKAAIVRASGQSSSEPEPVREESTLVPA
jgi:hypothetical protein